MAERLFRKGRFSFVGEVVASNEPMTTKKLSDTSKWSRTRLNLGVKNDSNAQFLTMEYIHTDSVKTCKLLGKDGEMFEVSLTDTMKPEVLEKVMDSAKIVVDLETDFEKKKEYTSLIFKKRNHEMKKEEDKTEDDEQKILEYTNQINELANNRVEFAHMKDVIKFINASLPNLQKHKVRITGQVKSNYYNSKNNLQYIPNFIEIVPEDTENHLKLFADIFYDKDGIDDDKKLKKMIVNGYVGERIKKVDKLYPLTVVIDYDKIDLENEEQVALLDFMKETFSITNKKMVHKIGVEINVINGAEVVEFDESCLTDQQKMAVKLGIKKVEDFKPRGNTYGDRIQELRVCCPDLKAFPNGCEEVFATKDLADYLVQDDSDVSISDVKKEETKEEARVEAPQEESAEDKLKRLFG